jgi:hypothetical protein
MEGDDKTEESPKHEQMRDEPGLDLACGSGGLPLYPPHMAQKILIFLLRGETNPENIRWQYCKGGERNRGKQELPDKFEHRDREDIEADVPAEYGVRHGKRRLVPVEEKISQNLLVTDPVIRERKADMAIKTRKNVFRVDSRPSGNASLVAMRMFAARTANMAENPTAKNPHSPLSAVQKRASCLSSRNHRRSVHAFIR